jgi:DNA-binding HxlR family transcriptional regulator
MNQCTDPITNSLKLIAGKWKIAIIYNLNDGPKRFGELKRILPPITQQMLTKQLREMERDQLVHRKVYEVIPPKVEYSLTKFGRSLEPVMNSWCAWSKANQKMIQQIFANHQSSS